MNDIVRAFWNGKTIRAKTWGCFFEEVTLKPCVTYSCENRRVVSRNGSVLTFHLTGRFDMMADAVHRVGDVLMWTDWCLLPVHSTRNWLYRIANANDLRVCAIQPGLTIDAATNATNGEPAPDEERDERVLKQKYLTLNPLKTVRAGGKTYYLILALNDPSQYLATDRRQDCFVILDSRSEITALNASATLIEMHKAFRSNDVLGLLKNAEPADDKFRDFLRSHAWVKANATPQLLKLFSVWALIH